MLLPLLFALTAEPYATASRSSLLFDHEVERAGFHFQVAFGVGGGARNEGLFHAMELGGTFDNGLTLALLHTFVQSKGVLGADRVPVISGAAPEGSGPDLLGGWMLELKAPILVPEVELKLAAGFGGLHDQREGIAAIPGFGWFYGVDFHLPFYATSGATLGAQVMHVLVDTGHYWAFGVGVGYTWF